MIVAPVVCDDFKKLVKTLPPLDLEKGPWIAGGTARKLFQHQNWKSGDVDIFFRDSAQFVDWQGEFLKSTVGAFDTAFDTDFDVPLSGSLPLIRKYQTAPQGKFYLAHQTANALTYKSGHSSDTQPLAVQLIRARWGRTVQEIWDTFDFDVCEFATDGNLIVASETAVEAALSREITLKDSQNTKNLPLRVLKYHLHGFSMTKDVLKTSVEEILEGNLVWDTDY